MNSFIDNDKPKNSLSCLSASWRLKTFALCKTRGEDRVKKANRSAAVVLEIPR